MIKQEEFKAWVQHPVTQEIFRIIKEYKDESEKQLLASGGMGPNVTMLGVGELMGRINCINEILEISYDGVQAFAEEGGV